MPTTLYCRHTPETQLYAHDKAGLAAIISFSNCARGGERRIYGTLEDLPVIGNSGDAREPHVHFQVQTSSDPLAGEGVPYLIDHYRVKAANDIWQTSTRQMPLRNMLVDFGGPQGTSPSR